MTNKSADTSHYRALILIENHPSLYITVIQHGHFDAFGCDKSPSNVIYIILSKRCLVLTYMLILNIIFHNLTSNLLCAGGWVGVSV